MNMNCNKCGQEIPETDDYCPNCGEIKILENNVLVYGILSALLPIVGFILYKMWKDKLPKTISSIVHGLWASIPIYIIMIGLILFGSFNKKIHK